MGNGSDYTLVSGSDYTIPGARGITGTDLPMGGTQTNQGETRGVYNPYPEVTPITIPQSTTNIRITPVAEHIITTPSEKASDGIYQEIAKSGGEIGAELVNMALGRGDWGVKKGKAGRGGLTKAESLKYRVQGIKIISDMIKNKGVVGKDEYEYTGNSKRALAESIISRIIGSGRILNGAGIRVTEDTVQE